jgi:hypothetical protein
MKHILIFILLCFASELWAQYPAGANKLVLGRQTTGDGLIFRGNGSPAFTPANNTNAWFFLDTAAQVLYTHIGGNWVALADTITSGGSVTLSGEVVGPSTATKLDTVDRVIFDPTNGGADSTYKLTYNANDFTLHFGMGIGDAIYQMGQELYYPPCINKTAATIYRGQPVMIDTAGIVQGDRLAVMPAFANGLPANYIVGVAAHDIAPNNEGLITWFGYVREVKESDVAASGVTLDVGDILYLSATPGKYQDTEPTPPALNSTIALVVRKPNANNMTLLVRPWLNEKLGDLTDVDLAGLTNGQVIVWDSANSKWVAASKQDPLTGTGLVKSTSGTITYVADSSANWNAAYNDRITAAAFTGTDTKTLTLTQQDAGTITANFTDLQGVTSVATGVGLSGGTITTSGTISADTTVLASKTWVGTRGYLTSEVDGSITNEGSLTVGAGTGTTSVISSNTNGSTDVTIAVSTGLSIAEAGNTITLTNTLPENTSARNTGSVGESLFMYQNGGILNFRKIALQGSLNVGGATSDSTLYINGFDLTTARNLSASVMNPNFVFRDKVSNELQFRQLVQANGVNIASADSTLTFTADTSILVSKTFLTNQAYTSNVGTVTSIATNNGITGGTITSSGTIGLTGQALALHNLATNGIIARTGVGTVEARTITAGTGISISNGDGASGNPTITNSAPDQTVAITGAGINSVSGTYPNFTITGTEVDGSVSNEGSLTVGAGTGTTSIINSNTSGSTGVTIEASTGLSISEAGNTITLTNSAPDQTVVLTAGNAISTSGTYPNFTIASTAIDSTTARNINNTGEGIFRAEVGNELQFKKLVQGSGVTLTAADSTITIAATGGGGTVTSITAGAGLTGGTITTSGTIAADTSGVLVSKSFLTNQGYTTNAGTVTSIATGTGLTGGTITGSGTVSADTTVLSTKSFAENQSPVIGSSLTLNPISQIYGRPQAKDTIYYYGSNGIIVSGGDYELNIDNRLDISITNDTSIISTVARLADTASTLRTLITNSAVTARNINATGEGIFRAKVGSELQFKKLVAGVNISLTTADSTITIAGNAGTVTSIATNNGITGGTITSSGTIGLTGQALALHNLSTNGLIARTSAGNVAARTITAGTGISVTNGDGVSGNPTITNSLPEATTARNIGGTGEGIYRAEVADEIQLKKLIAGSNITLTPADSSITIAAAAGANFGTVAANKVAFGAAAGDTLTSNTNLHWDNTNGRLGINNTSPSERLQVGGNVRAERFVVNTFGSQTLNINNFAPTGAVGNNLFIGNGGANSTFTSGDAGSYNVGVGFGTLVDNTTGSFNTGLAFGALNKNTTGAENMAVGVFALRDNTTGSYNVAIGTNSLLKNTTGNYNTAFSQTSLSNNTTGSLNVAIGAFSLFSNTTGQANVGISQDALAFNTTGSNNVAIAKDAGKFINNGSNNTLSENSLFIGVDTRASTSGNTNETVIGYEGRGNGSNTTTLGNTSTTGTFLAAGNLNLTGQAATLLQTARHTTSNTAGNNLTLKVGGATSGATDKNGGDLVLESGVATGTGSSDIIFSTAAPGTTGTTNRNPAERMRINGDGNVGIGFNNPTAAKLTIRSGAFSTMRLLATTTGEAATINFFGSNNTTFYGVIDFNSLNTEITRAGNLPIAFRTDGTEKMRIQGNGRVGIGTIDPKATLHVNGSLSRNAPVQTNTNYTVLNADSWIICAGSGSITLTLPTASDWTGREIMVKTVEAQTVVSNASNVVPLAGGSAGTAILAATAGKWATLVSNGTNWIIMQAN